MIRLAIVGIGSIAQVYLRLYATGQITGCQVTALCSRNRQNLEAAAQNNGLENAALFTSYEDLLASGCADAVMICTPHAQHPAMALAAVKAGLHPLIEKPVGADSDQVRELVAALRAAPHITAGVLYCRRAAPAFATVKQLVSEGALGELKRASWLITNLYRTPAYHASQPWRGSWQGEGGGVLMNQASHQLDVLCWLCGPATAVTAQCGFGRERAVQVETEAAVLLELQNGASAQFIASSREFPGTNRLELSGSKGQLILENDCRLTLRRLQQDEREFAQSAPCYFGPIPFEEEQRVFSQTDNFAQQAAIVNDFISALEAGKPPLCPVAEALASLEIINAAYLSAWESRRVALPLPAGAFGTALQTQV